MHVPVNESRLQDTFCALVRLDSPSCGESAVCSRLKEYLNALGLHPEEDSSAAILGGDTGNLYTYVPGTLPLAPLLFSAHMDTVEPSRNKRPIVHPGGRITSDGSTVLGGDDAAGLAVILEAVTLLQEHNIPHRPLELVFDPAEEIYCQGIRAFDFSRLRSKEAYVLDVEGPVGTGILQAPTLISFSAVFHGRASHAAFAPQNGRHAIKAAAQAIDAIGFGIVGDCSVNIGTIEGGTMRNIIPERCALTGEIRSFSDASAQEKLAETEQIMRRAAEEYGCTVEFESETFLQAYSLPLSDPAAVRFSAACRSIGREPALSSTYGGSDNNHFAQHGIRGLVIAPGMFRIHSREEYVELGEMSAAVQLLLYLMTHDS